jgi:hypothetical protein
LPLFRFMFQVPYRSDFPLDTPSPCNIVQINIDIIIADINPLNIPTSVSMAPISFHPQTSPSSTPESSPPASDSALASQ